MPAAHVDRRPDVLDWASEYGWTHDEAHYDDGQIVRDIFTKGELQVRAVWLSTPFSDAMWARGLLTRTSKAPLTLPKVTGTGTRATVEGVLKGTHPAVAG